MPTEGAAAVSRVPGKFWSPGMSRNIRPVVELDSMARPQRKGGVTWITRNSRVATEKHEKDNLWPRLDGFA
jgi:hypothetical protein